MGTLQIDSKRTAFCLAIVLSEIVNKLDEEFNAGMKISEMATVGG